MKYQILGSFFLKIFTSFILFTFFSNSVLAATWYVDTTADNDPNTCVSGEQDNDDDCTFRDAVSQAAASDMIQFLENLTIVNTESGLTAYDITQNGLTIDGTTNTVNFDGNNLGGSTGYSYLKVSGDNLTIRNLNVYNYDGGAIVVNGDNATISSNNLGVQSDDATSSEIFGAVSVNGAANTTISNNLIGGSATGAIYVGNSAGTTDVSITGNYIGVNSSGVDLNNLNYGILLETGTMNGGNGGVEGVVIGGSNVSDRNFISGNENPGIGIVGTATVDGTVTVQNNYIGVAPDGSTAVPNAVGALEVRDAGFWVAEEVGTGLTLNLFNNLISGNSGDGVKIDSGGTVNIYGNDIGFTSGGAALANQGDGIQIDAQTVTIGSNLDGTNDGTEENNIGNNTGNGIFLTGDDTLTVNIRSNFIGMYEGSSTAAGNGADGINVALTNAGDGTVNIGAVGVTQAIDGRNSIGNNSGDAIDVDTFMNGASSIMTIINNLIGINPNALTDADNTAGGVVVDLSSGTTTLRIGTNGDGTSDTSEANVITNSGGDGVYAGNGITTLTVAGNAIGAGPDGSGDYNTADGNAGDGIEVNGTNFNAQITVGGDAAAEANIIGNNTGAGVKITDAGSTAQAVRVEGNSIGVGEDGTTALGNTSFGVSIGEAAAISLLNNVVSNNSTYGVNITGGTTLTVTGNKIGTTTAGTAVASNVSYGIYLAASAMTTANIGAADGRNIIAATVATTAPGDGVYVADMADASTITFKNNYIGTDGTADLGNVDDGIEIADATGSLTVNVGGIAAGEGNVISGNNDDGVVFSGTGTITANLYGNYIGLNAAGTGAVANGGAGVDANNANLTLTIGNGASTGRNVISGNTGPGLDLTSGTLTVRGNYIGTNATAAAVLGNGSGAYASGVAFGGILMRSGTLTLGGSTSGQENVISGNYGQGLMVLSDTALSIISNYFGTNSSGTDLGNQAASGITYDLVSGTTEDTALNGSGILFYNNGSATINNPIVTGNVIGSNDGTAVAVIGTSGGGGQTWTSGYFKNNFFGSLADQTAAANGATFEFYANRNSGNLTSFSVGSATTSEKNYIKNSASRLGFRLVDVTASHLAGNGIADFYNNNTYAYSTCPDQQLLQVLSGTSQTSTVCVAASTTTTTSSGAGGSASSSSSSTDQSSSTSNDSAKEETAKEETKEQPKEEVKEQPKEEPKEEVKPQPRPQPRVETVKEEQIEADAALSDLQVEELIENLQVAEDEESEEEEVKDVVIEKAQEAAVVRDAVTTGFQNLDEDEKEEVRNAVDVVVRDSLSGEMERVLAGSGSGDSGLVLHLNNEKRTVKNAQEVEEIVEEILDDILEGGTDVDGNRMDDSLQIGEVGTLFEEDADDDGFDLAEEYSFRLDPLKKDELPKKPRAIFPAEKGQVSKVGRRPVVKLLGQKNEEVEVVLVSAEEQKVSFDFGDYLFSSVLGAEAAAEKEPVREQISLGKIKLDETGKAAFGPETDLPEGKYYVVTKGKNGISEEISTIEIDHDDELDAPELSWSDEYLKGEAQPGSIIFVTWKSLILSSVVIADASQGEFEVLIPEDLPEGDHNVLVFAYDPSKSLVGNLASLVFDI